MADVEKININSTDYDIADAYALRNKSTTAAYSFVDKRAGTPQYLTTGASLSECNIIGDSAYVIPTSASGITIFGRSSYASGSAATVIGNYAKAGMQSVSIGNSSGNTNSYTVNIGCNSLNSGTESVAVGETSTATSYSTAVGRNARATSTYTTALGYNANATASYSIALGVSVGASYQHSISIGYGANAANSYSVSIGSYARANYYSVAIGRDSYANNSFSVQLGNGTNNNYGSLQFRDWPLVNSNGKIYEERLPNGLKTATSRFPNLYDIDEEKISEQSILYTGPTNDSYKNSQFYRGRVRYGYPHFNCGWADTEWLDSNTDVMIDQQKLFIKLAEITKQRIDDDDIENGLIGGDNAEMSIYLKYDADNDYYFLYFDSDSFEKAFNGTPDSITGLSFDDLADYGIYFRNFHMPSDLDGEYEICDIYYYAPAYIDGYDWNDSPSYINYFRFLSVMSDSDYGAGYVIPDITEWYFEVDGTTYSCPIIPKTYEWNGDEYDYVEFRWEWADDEGLWYQYINGDQVNTWTTAQLASQFGIYVDAGEEGNVEYIGLSVRGGDQRYWEQFDPIDSVKYATSNQITTLESQITNLSGRAFQQMQSNVDLNNYTTTGSYVLDLPQTGTPSNLPTQAAGSKAGYLFVMARSSYVRQILMTEQVHRVISTTDHGNYCSNVFIRTRFAGTWTSWQKLLAEEDFAFITGFSMDSKQMLVHPANSEALMWETIS